MRPGAPSHGDTSGGGAEEVPARQGLSHGHRTAENPGNAENLTRAELRPRDPGAPVLVSLKEWHGKRRSKRNRRVDFPPGADGER